MRHVLITHKNCTDGAGAELAVREWDKRNSITNREVIYAQYGANQEKDLWKLNTDDIDLIIADFSFSRETLIQLNDRLHKVTVLDHHKTAKEALEGLDFCKFDINKSGAVLTWEYLFPNEEVPILLKYIQDRDLWNWRLVNSKEVSAGLTLIDKKDINELSKYLYDVNPLISSGAVVLIYQDTIIKNIVNNKKYLPRVNIGGYDVICINTTTLVSEIGNALVPNEPFVALYFDKSDARVISLRGNGSVDVSEVAKLYGGGGHREAAGCSIDLVNIQVGLDNKLNTIKNAI